MPRLSVDERQARDSLILRLHLAGVPMRDIGQQVGLSVGGVHKIVTRLLRASVSRRSELDADAAVEMYLERMEALLRASWPRAIKGDARSNEQCRRLLDSMARVQGIVGTAAAAMADFLPPEGVDDDDGPEIGEDGMDDLQRYRFARYGTLD